jgi:hypothetical protein
MISRATMYHLVALQEKKVYLYLFSSFVWNRSISSFALLAIRRPP